jgi:hypothetical protein
MPLVDRLFFGMLWINFKPFTATAGILDYSVMLHSKNNANNLPILILNKLQSVFSLNA